MLRHISHGAMATAKDPQSTRLPQNKSSSTPSSAKCLTGFCGGFFCINPHEKHMRETQLSPLNRPGNWAWGRHAQASQQVYGEARSKTLSRLKIYIWRMQQVSLLSHLKFPYAKSGHCLSRSILSTLTSNGSPDSHVLSFHLQPDAFNCWEPSLRSSAHIAGVLSLLPLTQLLSMQVG